MAKWLVGLGVVVAACAPDLGIGDVRCEDSSACVVDAGQQCVLVTEVRASTGACLQSTGVKVCRPLCTTCPPANACGCVCP